MQVVVETGEGVQKQDKRRDQQKKKEDPRNAFVAYTDPSRNIAVGDDSAELSKSQPKAGSAGLKIDADSGVYHKQVVHLLEVL